MRLVVAPSLTRAKIIVPRLHTVRRLMSPLVLFLPMKIVLGLLRFVELLTWTWTISNKNDKHDIIRSAIFLQTVFLQMHF